MKKAIGLLTFLLFANAIFVPVLAQNETGPSITDNILSFLKGVFVLLITINPIILLVLGVILIIASKFANIVGIVLIIVAIIHIFLLIMNAAIPI